MREIRTCLILIFCARRALFVQTIIFQSLTIQYRLTFHKPHNPLDVETIWDQLPDDDKFAEIADTH